MMKDLEILSGGVTMFSLVKTKKRHYNHLHIENRIDSNSIYCYPVVPLDAQERQKKLGPVDGSKKEDFSPV